MTDQESIKTALRKYSIRVNFDAAKRVMKVKCAKKVASLRMSAFTVP